MASAKITGNLASQASGAAEASLRQEDVSSLLRLLTPKPGATAEEESRRASLIMQQAARGPPVDFASANGMDQEAADRLKALSILQGVFGGICPKSSSSRSTPGRLGEAEIVLEKQAKLSQRQGNQSVLGPGQSGAEARSVPQPSARSAAHLAGPPCDVHELRINLDRLPVTMRLLEVVDSQMASQTYMTAGEEDPFGSKAWPAAYLCAQRLLAEGVRGRTVLELGCGTGLISNAALLGGASLVLATDRSGPNVDLAMRSARLNGTELSGELFDVTLPYALPSRSSPVCGNLRTPAYTAQCADKLPEVFDFLVFSDVLYWPKEAIAFGRRAAQAFAAGSTVIIADPGRRRDDFLGALREELGKLGVEPLPKLELVPVKCPEHINEWVSAEVRTASELFCKEPFELVLRQPSRPRHPLPKQLPRPTTFEVVD